MIATGESIPLLCVEGVPGLPGAPQDEAGLTRKFEMSHVGGATYRTTPISRSALDLGISPSNEHPGLISFRMDWLDLCAVQGTLKSLLQHHSSKASILRQSAFFTVQLSTENFLFPPGGHYAGCRSMVP